MNALKLLQPIKDKYSSVTYADLFQLASATAIEVIPLFWFDENENTSSDHPFHSYHCSNDRKLGGPKFL